jgi:hypothetical protein
MKAPSAWVDDLFDRLSARYGVAFLRQYGDIDAAAVKADWAKTLGGLSPAAIKAGLENLPDKPPHAGQFRRLCVDHLPREEHRVFRALPAPRTAMPDAIRARLLALSGRRGASVASGAAEDAGA